MCFSSSDLPQPRELPRSHEIQFPLGRVIVPAVPKKKKITDTNFLSSPTAARDSKPSLPNFEPRSGLEAKGYENEDKMCKDSLCPQIHSVVYLLLGAL